MPDADRAPCRGYAWLHGLALLLASAVLLAAVVHFVTTLAEVIT